MWQREMRHLWQIIQQVLNFVMRSAVIYRESADGRRCVALDAAYAGQLLAYITQDERHQAKFDDIVNILLNNLRNTNLYDKEDINTKSKDVAAMKLFKGQANDRIYCKQGSLSAGDGRKVYVVVAARLHTGKKSQHNTQAEKNLINAVASYVYDYTTFTHLDDDDEEDDAT